MRVPGFAWRVSRAAVLLALPLCTSSAGAPSEDKLSDDSAAGVIRRIEFAGLRRIPAATLRTHITSREGQLLDPARIEEDVRALDRLGWFESVTAEAEPLPLLLADAQIAAGRSSGAGENWDGSPGAGSLVSSGPSLDSLPGGMMRAGLRLIFIVEERPFLARVDFRGSRLLSRERIEAVLAEKGIAPKVAAPASRTELWHAARAIEAALGDLGHPQAQVHLRLQEIPTAAVRATFEIQDGPAVPVGQVGFEGNRAFSEAKLRRQMKRVAPGAPFAELRRRNIYTPSRLAEDLERVANFYRDHGFPEARVGQPVAEISEDRTRRWFPWPRRRSAPRFHISIPVEEGRYYRLAAVEVESDLGGEPAARRASQTDAPLFLPGLRPGTPYSQHALERARESLSKIRTFRAVDRGALPPEVEVQPQFDPDAATVRITFRVREARPYVVRRLEFVGQRHFSDRYYRRRILLKEDEPLDTRKLELGLALLSRSGFIRPVKRQDVIVRLDEERHAADVKIRVEEIGRQRFSLTGGRAGFGSTLGVVYNVFDLFGGEELLTGQLEGGPQSVQVLLGLAKEGVFGTRASFGLSVFRNVIRPNLPGAAGRRRLFTSRSSGLGLGWSYPLTPRDTLGVNYALSHASTRQDLFLPAGRLGVPGVDLATASLLSQPLVTRTSSHSLGLDASHDTGRDRLDAATSVSGGWLGGNENLLRSSVEYSRLQADPLSSLRNSWAFRGYLAGVSSTRGDLPLHARYFPGDALVRGFRAGELAPYALVLSSGSAGAPTFRAGSPGANLVGAVNAEYRIPIVPRTEAAAFFDAGSGWLLPNWLGPNRPALLGATNGVLRASTGIELRWQVPGVGQTLRIHYALNPLRLRRSILLPDGSLFRPPDRHRTLGWALGSLI